MIVGYAILLFFLGASIGSFLNVMVSRAVAGEDWVRGRSKCDWCKRELSWYDMIPLLSFVAYRGRARCCSRELSWQHPIVEGLTGLLFVWWYVMGNIFFQLSLEPLRTLQAGYWLVIAVVLLVVVISDLRYGLVPTLPVYGAIILTLIYRVALLRFGPLTPADFVNYLVAGAGVLAFFGLLHLITRGYGMGMGDVILAPLMGLILGYPRSIVGVLLAFWSGALVGVIMLVSRHKKLGQTIPFAPFMVLGTVVALLLGNQIWSLIT